MFLLLLILLLLFHILLILLFLLHLLHLLLLLLLLNPCPPSCPGVLFPVLYEPLYLRVSSLPGHLEEAEATALHRAQVHPWHLQHGPNRSLVSVCHSCHDWSPALPALGVKRGELGEGGEACDCLAVVADAGHVQWRDRLPPQPRLVDVDVRVAEQLLYHLGRPVGWGRVG